MAHRSCDNWIRCFDKCMNKYKLDKNIHLCEFYHLCQNLNIKTPIEKCFIIDLHYNGVETFENQKQYWENYGHIF